MPHLTPETSWKLTTRQIITYIVLGSSFLFSVGAYVKGGEDTNSGQNKAIEARVTQEEFKLFVSKYDKDRAIDSIRTAYVIEQLADIKQILKQNK